MRTIIFSTHEESKSIQDLLGGEIFQYAFKPCGAAIEILDHLNDNEDAVAIIVGDALLMGWCTYHATSVIFSKNYSTDERVREQARGRVRYAPRLKDWGE